MNDDFIPIKEAASKYGVSAPYIYDLRNKGVVAYKKEESKAYVSRADMEAFYANRKGGSKKLRGKYKKRIVSVDLSQGQPTIKDVMPNGKTILVAAMPLASFLEMVRGL